MVSERRASAAATTISFDAKSSHGHRNSDKHYIHMVNIFMVK